MTKTIADIIIQSLANTGVKRVYGLPGDSLNGFTDALRRNGTIQWEHVRHEEAAAFAAGASRFAPGREMHGRHGASANAPGRLYLMHHKTSINGHPGASGYAPGQHAR